ncbi:hypothetical protein FBZ84_1353 [Azospirillum baldaniorum]|nr:hypothetical protein FBZ84_1353 [Azospirillum baldaniorum]
MGPKAQGKDHPVEAKPKPKSTAKRGLPPINVEAIKQQVAPLVASVPSQQVLHGDITPPRASEPVKILDDENFEQAINRLMEESRERAVLVGDLLLEWKEQTPHGQFMTLIEERISAGALRINSYQMANRLMVMAQAVRDRLIPSEAMPREAEAAYLLSSLKPDEIKQAESAGLVHREVRTADVKAFRASIRPRNIQSVPATKSAIRARLRRLQTERKREESRHAMVMKALADEEARLRAELGEAAAE